LLKNPFDPWVTPLLHLKDYIAAKTVIADSI